MSCNIKDSRVQLLYLIAQQYDIKTGGTIWKDAVSYITERSALSFQELCQSDTVRATAWYHALSAIPTADMSLSEMDYSGILISAIDDVIHIEVKE
jgi:hypothetical protein